LLPGVLCVLVLIFVLVVCFLLVGFLVVLILLRVLFSLVVLGVPSNDFGAQEPGSAAEIKPPVEDSATAMVSRRAFRRAAIVSASDKRSFNGAVPVLRFL